jgi:hypothetical protein
MYDEVVQVEGAQKIRVVFAAAMATTMGCWRPGRRHDSRNLILWCRDALRLDRLRVV